MCGCMGTSGMDREEKMQYEKDRITKFTADIEYYKNEAIAEAQRKLDRAKEELAKLEAETA